MLRRILLVGNLVLGVVFLFTAVRFTGALLTPQSGDVFRPQVSLPSKTEVVEGAKPLSYYSVITQRNLFKNSLKPEPPLIKERIKLELPKTTLRLKLRGTVVGSSRFSRAMIEDESSRKQELYRLGEMVAGEAEIIGIERNRVVLRRGNREEVLLMYAEMAGIVSKRTTVAAIPLDDSGKVKQGKAKQDKKVITSEDLAMARDSTDRIVKKMMGEVYEVNNLRDVLQVANGVITQAKVDAYLVDGNMQGVRVKDIRPGSIYERMGMRSGDVIKRVNGYQMESMGAIFQAYQKLQEQSSVTLDVERDGKTVTLVYEVRDGENKLP